MKQPKMGTRNEELEDHSRKRKIPLFQYLVGLCWFTSSLHYYVNLFYHYFTISTTTIQQLLKHYFHEKLNIQFYHYSIQPHATTI